jgi:hypothetical protein
VSCALCVMGCGSWDIGCWMWGVGCWALGHGMGDPWVYFAVPISVPMNTVPLWVGVQCLLRVIAGYLKVHGFRGVCHKIIYYISKYN